MFFLVCNLFSGLLAGQVHSGRRRGRVPQRRAGARLGVGVRRSPLRLHRRLRDHAARREGAWGAVSIQVCGALLSFYYVFFFGCDSIFLFREINDVRCIFVVIAIVYFLA